MNEGAARAECAPLGMAQQPAARVELAGRLAREPEGWTETMPAEERPVARQQRGIRRSAASSREGLVSLSAAGTSLAPRELKGELGDLIDGARRRLRGLMRRQGIPARDAEDIVQETLLALVARWETIGRPRAWLAAVVAHKCAAYRRQGVRQRVNLVDPAELEALAGSCAVPQEAVVRRLDLARLCTALPARQRRLLRLIYVAGLTHREASIRLGGRGRETLRKDLYRALRRMRQRARALRAARHRERQTSFAGAAAPQVRSAGVEGTGGLRESGRFVRQ
jgi:RNA polymerase sigma factor (sigma-70 family)